MKKMLYKVLWELKRGVSKFSPGRGEEKTELMLE